MKKTYLLIGLVVAGFLAWYLILKPYDYLVSFKARTFPGAINQSIKLWNISLKGGQIESSENLLELKQIVPYNDSTFQYHYKINPINDSMSQVKVYVTDLDHSIHNRITYPFSETNFEKRVKSSLTSLNEKLNEHISKFRVQIIGESEIKEKFCAYVPIECKQIEKALGMMQYYSILDNAMAANNIKLDGRPFIMVNDWDMKNDRIQYDFCYPIINNDTLFEHPEIAFKKIESKKALKARYNGNYITSDRAWYALRNYAMKNDIKIENKPIEVFWNNPNMGGDELQWTAEVFMPVSEN